MVCGKLVKPVQQEKLTAVLENRVVRTSLKVLPICGGGPGPSGPAYLAKMRQNWSSSPEDALFYGGSKIRHCLSCNGEALIDDTIKDLENEFANKFVRIHAGVGGH